MILDETSVKILKHIKDNRPARIEDISNFLGDKLLAQNCVTSLKTKNLIRGLNYNTHHTPSGIHSVAVSPYEITADGLAFLEDRNKQEKQEKWENFHKWANTIIAVLALLTAIYAAI